MAGLCFNIRVLDFTCIHRPWWTYAPSATPARKFQPPLRRRAGRHVPYSFVRNVEPFCMFSLSLSLSLPCSLSLFFSRTLLPPASLPRRVLLSHTLSRTLSTFLSRNCTPIRPLFSATPSNRVLFNWWDVCAFPCAYTARSSSFSRQCTFSLPVLSLFLRRFISFFSSLFFFSFFFFLSLSRSFPPYSAAHVSSPLSLSRFLSVLFHRDRCFRRLTTSPRGTRWQRNDETGGDHACLVTGIEPALKSWN